ncbi:YcaO-like family protein [Nostocaceae cyanobacterium CENA369]|uniref:YcaO-like family protein n=1 Tax=Dendronalium phyllosphericum CENA369 TaxID=1725256 RepID=A0A8J7I1Z4_9NOST|nr:YcaO-like family protein [Dendronalium phyllosphericum]MBH8572078.1 YcaO-like family protein [Dendronalium phyllosphericum CENA369]
MNSTLVSPRWRDLISPHTGVIRALDRLTKPYTEFELPVLWQAELAHFNFCRQQDDLRYGVGKGMTDEQAIIGAIGEALERYCGSIVERQKVIVSSYEELSNACDNSFGQQIQQGVGDRAVPPPAFFSFSDKQYSDPAFGFPAFEPAMQTSWVAALNLASNQQTLVPAALVYLNFCSDLPGDYILPVTTNGMASGFSVEFAAYSGLCELIERDALIITWLNRLPAPRIYFDGQPGIETEIARNYARFGIELMAFDFTTDIQIPVIAAMAIDRSGKSPSLVIGLGCHLDGRTALRKAIFEVCQARPHDIERMASGAGTNLHKYDDIQDLQDHSAFFFPAARLGELDFLLHNERSLKVADLPTYTASSELERLRSTVEKLHSVGADAYLVDVTTPDIASIGFRVVRTLASQLVPIYFGYGQEPLGSQRLFEVPERLGYGGRRTEDDLNPCPHPLD